MVQELLILDLTVLVLEMVETVEEAEAEMVPHRVQLEEPVVLVEMLAVMAVLETEQMQILVVEMVEQTLEVVVVHLEDMKQLPEMVVPE